MLAKWVKGVPKTTTTSLAPFSTTKLLTCFASAIPSLSVVLHFQFPATIFFLMVGTI